MAEIFEEPLAGLTPRSVSLYRIELNVYGYTYGKHPVYYGVGLPLFAAENDAGTFRREVRAQSREEAARTMGFELNPDALKVKIKGLVK